MESYPKELTTSKTTVKRCVNLDWLEIFAREPLQSARDADYYRSKGIEVRVREYGTRVYREMFVIYGTDGEPLIEVRRNPASQGLNGIHDPEECHLRLVNRACYFDNAALLFHQFLMAHGYRDVRISRVDICLDFDHFDEGDDPQAFVRRYFRRRYSKINQGNINAHGSDAWTGQEWNSLSWGAKTSPISTKLYNKTMELYNPKDNSFAKPWIRQAWCICGLVDDWQRVTKNNETVNVWRVEFSIRSAVKNWVPIEIDGKHKNFQSLQNTLEVYADRGRILVMFASLAQHYFRFKKYKEGVRKDRCPDKILFRFTSSEVTYKVGRNDYAAGSEMNIRTRYARLIALIQLYMQTHSGIELHAACELIINSMKEEELRSDLQNPWSREELKIMQTLLALRTRDPNLTYEVAMSRIKEILNITNRTIDVF